MNTLAYRPQPQHQVHYPESWGDQKVTLADLKAVEQALTKGHGAMTLPQRAFFEALLAHPSMDPEAAAKLSGLTMGKVNRWLADPSVRSQLDKLITARLRRVGLDKDELVRQGAHLLFMAKGEVPIVKAQYNPKTGEWEEWRGCETNLPAANVALSNLMKAAGMFGDANQRGASQVVINLDFGNDERQVKVIESIEAA